MPDKKLTDSEIVKALECCVTNDCHHCPMSHHTTGTYNEHCGDDLMKYALDLINRQDEKMQSLQAENERLKEQIKVGDKIYEDACNEFDNDLKIVNEKLKTAKAESEDYKALYEGLKAEHLETIKAIKHCKAEAYKEFAEKLDKASFITGYTTVFGGKDVPIKHITMANVHSILKELVGDSRA